MFTGSPFRHTGAKALLTVALPVCWLLAACSSKDYNNATPQNKYNISATLSGTQEVPSNSSTATGSVSGTYNAGTYILTFQASWSNLSAAPTAMHFHGPAMAGQNASVVLGVTGFPATASGNVSVTDTLTAAQGADLVAGKWYYNIHTPGFPGGEIRGQVTATLSY